jgi:protein-disulfide isomerase
MDFQHERGSKLMNWVSAQMMARIASPYRPSDTQRIEMHWVTMISPPMSGHLSNRVQARMVRKSAKTVQLALGLAAATLQCFLSVAGAQDLAIITLAGQKQMLANPGTDPAGARNPDVTIVEYFDYNCPYCKKLAPVLQTLLAQDPKIAVIYKDWPILSEVSVYASSAAIAAGWQGKYLAAHDALINGPPLSHDEQVDAILQTAGVNIDALRKDRTSHAKEIDALLERNDEEAHALTLKGTPGLVIGRQLLPGVTDLNTLKQLVAKARHSQ